MSRVTKLRAHAISEELLAPDAGLEITQEGKLSALPILTQVTGGLTYKGLFDPTTGVPNPVEVSAKQGWFYKVSQSGTWLGLTLNVGDNIYYNADVPASDAEDIPSLLSKIDVIDNTESIMNLEDLHNVTAATLVDGQALVYNADTSEWINQDIVYSLNDLNDVTLSGTITNGQGLVYSTATQQWINQDIVEVLDDLSDVYYDSITSSEYSNSTAVATLTINKDHILEFTAGATGTRRIPNTLNPENNYLVINNIGLGELTLVANTNATFWAFGQPSTEPIEVPARRRVVLTGASIEYPAGSETFVTYWNVSISGISPRQSLTRVGTTAWTNGYINAYDVQGVASQGEINNIQTELDLSQTSLGLLPNGSFNYFENTNFMDSATSFRSADLKLDAALKAEQTSRISADNTLQSNINAEITARTNAVSAEASARIAADNILQTNINTEANTRSTADANLQTELNNVEAAIGLSATGTLVAFTATGVVAGKLTYLDAVNTLSGEIETIRDLVAGGIDHLQTELDNTQAALGGMTASGTFTAFAGTNYLNGAASFRAADLALDSAVKVNANAIVALQTKDAQLDIKDAALQTELDNTQASLGLTVGGALTPFTLTGVVAGKTTHLAAIDALSTELVEVRGLVVGGVDNLNLDLTGSADPESFTGFAGTYVSAETNFLSAIEALNDAIVAEKNASNLRMDGIDSTIEALDLALDTESQTRLTGDETLSGLITDLSDKFGEKPAHVVYVSGEYGNNSYNGSLYEPKASIAAALLSLPNDGSLAQVFVMPGVYSEDITLARTNTVLSGISPTGRVGHTSIINGSINIAPSFSAGGLFNNQISIENFLINKTGANPCINLGGTFLYITNVRNCQLFTDNANAGSLVKNTTALQARLQFTNCSITSTATGSNHCVELTAGSLFMDTCEVYRTNGSSSSRAIKLSGTATCPRITSLLCTVSNCAYAVESSVAITLGNSVIGNSTANGSGIYMSAGICTALYTTFDVAVGTGHVVDGAIGSAYVYAYNTYINDVTVGANIFKVALAGSLPAGLSQVAYSGFAEDVIVAHTAQNFTVAAQDSESFFVGIDNKFEDIDTAIAAAGKVETVNGVAPVEGSKDVLIDASNIAATITPSNYTALSSDAISTHLSAIDGELGDLATAIAAAGKVETVNGVAPVEGSKDVLIDASDIIVPASFNEGYIVADTLQSITAHFIAIDDAISALTLPASDIVYADEITAWSITSSSLSSIITGLNTKLADLTSLAFTADYADLQNVPTAGINQVILDTTADTINLLAGKHYIISTALNSIKVMNVPSLSTLVSNGDYIRITNWGNGIIRITETGEGSYLLNGENIIGGTTAGAYIEINARTTIDLYGFKLPPTYPVMWAAYYNTNIEINTRSAINGSILIFDQAKQEIVPSAYALSALAISGAAEDLITAATPTNFTAATLNAQVFFDGIDDKLGELSLASGIAATFTPSGYVTASSFLSDHLLGIDDKLSNLPVSVGSLGALNVADGNEKFVEVDWTANDSAILPANNGTQYLGGVNNLLHSVYTTEVQLGATNPKTLTKDTSNNLLWNTKLVKVTGAALYDGVQLITINGSQKTLNLGNVIYANGNGTETWNLPVASSAGAAVILNFAKDSTGSVTLAASSIEGSTTYSLQARGNQALVVWNGITYKVYESFQLRNSGGLQDLTEITSSTTLTKANTDLFSTASSDITVTLPLRSSMFLGEKIRITRSFSDGNITVNPNAADASATAFKTPKGNATNYSLRNRGDVVIFVAGASSWLVLDSSLNTTVQLYSSSPVQVLQSNTVSRLAFAGNAVVNLPKTSNCKDGDIIVLYPHGDKSVTINLNAADAGVSSIRQGSMVHGNSVTLTAINARNITARYDESNDQFIVESPFGSAAQYDAGTLPNQLLLVDSNGKLPAIDGSQLTGIVTGTGRFGYQKNTASFTALVGYHHSLDTTSSSIVATLPALSVLNDGDFIRIKFTTKGGANNVSIVTSGADTIEKLASINLTAQGEFLELIADTAGTNWEIVG